MKKTLVFSESDFAACVPDSMDPDVRELWDEIARNQVRWRSFHAANDFFATCVTLGFAGFAFAIVILINRVQVLEKNGSIKH
jgi:hypothetical protein